jgi:hypothetical protein
MIQEIDNGTLLANHSTGAFNTGIALGVRELTLGFKRAKSKIFNN